MREMIAERRRVFGNARAGIGAPVGLGIEAPPVEKIVFDELHVRVVAECLMVDVPFAGVGADDETRNA